jgi:hypothetical protein
MQNMSTTTPKRERLSTKQVAREYSVAVQTLEKWRCIHRGDPRYPRYHKYFNGVVFYFRDELEEDLKKMETDTDTKKEI